MPVLDFKARLDQIYIEHRFGAVVPGQLQEIRNYFCLLQWLSVKKMNFSRKNIAQLYLLSNLLVSRASQVNPKIPQPPIQHKLMDSGGCTDYSQMILQTFWENLITLHRIGNNRIRGFNYLEYCLLFLHNFTSRTFWWESTAWLYFVATIWNR